LCDVYFTIRNRIYHALDDDLPLNDEKDLKQIQLASLTFTDQKNGVKGEETTQSPSGDPALCPTTALGRLVLHHRKNHADPETPLYLHYNAHPRHRTWHRTTSEHVTNALRLAGRYCHRQTGIDPNLLSARSLRPGGATALLCANIDKDAIMLLGRWKSDAMLRYLRIQAMAKTFARKMLAHGNFTFHPQAFRDAQPPLQTPPSVQQLLQHTELYDDDADHPI